MSRLALKVAPHGQEPLGWMAQGLHALASPLTAWIAQLFHLHHEPSARLVGQQTLPPPLPYIFLLERTSVPEAALAAF